MKTRKLIYLLGLDGSGKTTNAKQLSTLGKSKYEVLYLYCQYKPILLKPLKVLAKFIFLKNTDEFIDYKNYNKLKKKYSTKMRILTRIYSYIWYIDYILQIIPQLLIVKFKKSDIILIDRYYLDSVVNLACLNNFSLEQMLRDSRIIESVLPRADLHLFLNVSEEKAYARKNDIQSIEYLAERKKKYFELAEVYNFKIIDADLPQKIVYKEILRNILNEYKK